MSAASAYERVFKDKLDISGRGDNYRQQFMVDAAMWYGCLNKRRWAQVTIVSRLFKTLYYGGVLYKKGEEWRDAAHDELPVAALLSHGGRVIIQLPKLEHRKEPTFWQWLQEHARMPQRGWATHGLSIRAKSKRRPLPRGRVLVLKEERGFGVSLGGHVSKEHFGFNPPLGGDGNFNPFSPLPRERENKIRADGRNGHIYVRYLAPTKTSHGGLLVGCENAEHGVEGGNPHTGAGHSATGAPQAVSATGGKKWMDMPVGPTTDTGGMVCDLIKPGWQFVRDAHGGQEFEPEWLDRPPKDVRIDATRQGHRLKVQDD